MEKKEKNLIDDIQTVRSKNNILWMDILRIAFDTAPEKAKKIMSEIHKNDAEVVSLVAKLADKKGWEKR